MLSSNGRRRCLIANDHPLAPKATDDLVEYLGKTTGSFAFGLPPPGQPGARRAAGRRARGAHEDRRAIHSRTRVRRIGLGAGRGFGRSGRRGRRGRSRRHRRRHRRIARPVSGQRKSDRAPDSASPASERAVVSVPGSQAEHPLAFDLEAWSTRLVLAATVMALAEITLVVPTFPAAASDGVGLGHLFVGLVALYALFALPLFALGVFVERRRLGWRRWPNPLVLLTGGCAMVLALIPLRGLEAFLASRDLEFDAPVDRLMLFLVPLVIGAAMADRGVLLSPGARLVLDPRPAARSAAAGDRGGARGPCGLGPLGRSLRARAGTRKRPGELRRSVGPRLAPFGFSARAAGARSLATCRSADFSR